MSSGFIACDYVSSHTSHCFTVSHGPVNLLKIYYKIIRLEWLELLLLSLVIFISCVAGLLQGAAGEGLSQQQLLDLLNTHGLGGLGGAGGFSPLDALRWASYVKCIICRDGFSQHKF